jgi:hypothetical protein
MRIFLVSPRVGMNTVEPDSWSTESTGRSGRLAIETWNVFLTGSSNLVDV